MRCVRSTPNSRAESPKKTSAGPELYTDRNKSGGVPHFALLQQNEERARRW
jgi:hypothetical protein